MLARLREALEPYEDVKVEALRQAIPMAQKVQPKHCKNMSCDGIAQCRLSFRNFPWQSAGFSAKSALYTVVSRKFLDGFLNYHP